MRGRLLKSIEGLVKQADVLGARRVDEARWLLTMNHLIKIAMGESVLDIQLMNWPVMGDGNAEHNADRGRLDDGTEGLVVFNARLLRESMDHPSCLVPGESTVNTKLVFEDPLP